MKIAVFTESYRPYISGVSRSVETAEEGLISLGHEVYVFAPAYPGYGDTAKNVFRFRSLPAMYPNFRLAVPFPWIIPGIKFDIVHSNSPFQLGLLSMAYAKKRKIPYIYTFHTLFTEYLHYIPLPKRFAEKIIYALVNWYCNRCSCIIVPTAKTKAYLESFGIKTRIETVPTGIDIGAVKKASTAGIKEKLGIPIDAKVLIYVGRLSKEKNIPFLFESFKEVISSSADKNVYLLVVAGGPEEKNLKKLAKRLGLSENIIFAGQVPYPKVFDYYKCADVFVFSSKTETQGLVAYEAKSCGLPVVALDAGGISDSVIDGEDGFLVSSQQSFAEKTLYLLQNDDIRRRFSENAARNAARDFSSESVAKKIESVYNSLVLKGQ